MPNINMLVWKFFNLGRDQSADQSLNSFEMGIKWDAIVSTRLPAIWTGTSCKNANDFLPRYFVFSSKPWLCRKKMFTFVLKHTVIVWTPFQTHPAYVIPQNIIHVDIRGFVVTYRSYADSGSCCVLVDNFANR